MDDIYLQTIGLLIGFICILAAAYFTAKVIGTRALKSSQGKYLKIIDRISLGSDKWIGVIQLGDSFFLIGCTNQQINLLGRIEQSNIVPLDSEQSSSFYKLIQNYLLKHREQNEVENDE